MKMPDSQPQIDELIRAVQRNCDISDAHHAGDAAMCIYLMRMREHYKWQIGIVSGESLDHKLLGGWIGQREAYLSSLEDTTYSPINLDGVEYDPFDHAGINRKLVDQNLIYCAGYGRRGKPVFCLGEITRTEGTDDYDMFVVGKEYAREMSAPAAMSLAGSIYIRQDAFTRTVWEMFEEWNWHRPRNAFYKAMSCGGNGHDTLAATHALASSQVENLILHEKGEVMAQQMLGDRWAEMLHCLVCTTQEVTVRAVRDNLADSISVLPSIISAGNARSIHFYFACFNSVREEIFPELKKSYKIWDETGYMDPLKAAVGLGQTHWLQTARELMSCYEQYGRRCGPHVQRVAESSFL